MGETSTTVECVRCGEPATGSCFDCGARFCSKRCLKASYLDPPDTAVHTRDFCSTWQKNQNLRTTRTIGMRLASPEDELSRPQGLGVYRPDMYPAPRLRQMKLVLEKDEKVLHDQRAAELAKLGPQPPSPAASVPDQSEVLAKTIWSVGNVNEDDDYEPTVELNFDQTLFCAPSAVLRGLRDALPWDVAVTAGTVYSAADLSALRESLNLFWTCNATTEVVYDAFPKGWKEDQMTTAAAQIDEWIHLSEPARLLYVTRFLGTGKVLGGVRHAVEYGKRVEYRHPVPRGELTVVALAHIPRGTFLGAYPGRLKAITQEPQNRTYQMALDHVPTEKHAGLNTREVLNDLFSESWCVDGLRYRNPINLVNHFNGYYEYGADGKEFIRAQPSTAFIDFWVQGVPHVGLVASRDIAAWSEVLVDYGANHWYDAACVAIAELSALREFVKSGCRGEFTFGEKHDPLPPSVLSLQTVDDIGMAIFNRSFPCEQIVVFMGPEFDPPEVAGADVTMKLLATMLLHMQLQRFYCKDAAAWASMALRQLKEPSDRGFVDVKSILKIKDYQTVEDDLVLDAEECTLAIVFGTAPDKFFETLLRRTGKSFVGKLFVNIPSDDAKAFEKDPSAIVLKTKVIDNDVGERLILALALADLM